MCDPVTAALMATSAGLSAAGGMVSSRAMNAQINQQNAFQQQMMERNREMRREELLRQDGYRRQQEAARTAGEENLTAQARERQIEDANKEATQNISDIQKDVSEATEAVPGIIASAAANNVVSENDYAKRLANAASDSRKRIAALTALGAYDLASNNRSMAMDKTAQGINLLNNFRKGSLATSEVGLGLNDSVAKNTTVGPQTNMLAAGQMIGGLGQLAGSAASGGMGSTINKKIFG
jgi:hypothetical protein